MKGSNIGWDIGIHRTSPLARNIDIRVIKILWLGGNDNLFICKIGVFFIHKTARGLRVNTSTGSVTGSTSSVTNNMPVTELVEVFLYRRLVTSKR